MKEEFKGILENISQNNNELDKLLNIESVDELYDYFLEKIPELSVEEFDNLMIEILETYTNEQKRIYKLAHKDLDNLAGGTNFGTKLSSGVLALLSIFQTPVFGNNNETRSDAMDSPNASISSKITKAYQYGKNVVSDKFQKTKEWIKKHPIKLTIGTIVIIVALYFANKHVKNQKPKTTIADRQHKIISQIEKGLQKLNTLNPASEEYKALHNKLVGMFESAYMPGLITKYTNDLIGIANQLNINIYDD